MGINYKGATLEQGARKRKLAGGTGQSEEKRALREEINDRGG